MAVVNVNGSGQLSVDSQSKLVGLVSTWHSWLLLTYGFCENGCGHNDSTKKNYHSIFIRLHLLHHWDAVYCYWCRPVWGQTRGPRNCILEAEMTGCCSLAHPSNSVNGWLKLRYIFIEGWLCVSVQMLELLVEKCLLCCEGGIGSLSPGSALRRVFECIASGMLLSGKGNVWTLLSCHRALAAQRKVYLPSF